MARKVVCGILTLSLVIASLLLIRGTQAHGSMQNPISRVYACYLEGPETPDSIACRDAIAMGGTQALYDWNEVNIRDAAGRHRELIPDGQLCSAGRSKYAAFDQPRTDWATTVLPASGSYTFRYAASTPHPGWFELYVTRDGYDPLQPLKWSDLEPTPFLRVYDPPIENGAYVMTGQLPQGKSGRHVIYSIWERTDSPEAFYYCSDVWFGPSPPPTPTTPPPCTAPAWSASTSYPQGAEVSHNSREWRAKWATSGQEPSTDGASNAWEILRHCQPGVPVTPTSTATPWPGGPTATPTSMPPSPSRTPTSPPASGASCQVAYSIINQWQGGFQAEVQVRNTGSNAINGWTLSWSFPGSSRIYEMWNASYTQSAAAVSARNAGWNGSIAPSGSVSFGFLANHSGAHSEPASFALNGAACSVAP